jgi:hypothetical protein
MIQSAKFTSNAIRIAHLRIFDFRLIEQLTLYNESQFQRAIRAN